MEFADENEFSLSLIRKDKSEQQQQRKSLRRSSSILKIPQPKIPLSEVDPNQQDGCKLPPLKKARRSENRRVSFADTCQIKEFPKDSPGAWHKDSSLENSPEIEQTSDQETPEISGLDKLLTGSIQHPGFTSTDEDVQEASFEEEPLRRVQVDPANYTLMVNEDMELTGLTRFEDEPPVDFRELQNVQNQNKVNSKFLQSLISTDKSMKSNSLQTEISEKLCNVKALEDPETYIHTAMNHPSRLFEENIQSSLSHLPTGTTTLSCQLSVTKRTPLVSVPASQKPELSVTKRTPLISVPSSQKPELNSAVDKEISQVDFGNKLNDQSIVEKPKLTGFLQSLLKSQRKEKTEGFQSTLSTSISSQHKWNKTIISGDGMDETAILDNTIWTIEKEANSINHLHQGNVSVGKIQDERSCEMTQVFHRGGAMEETKVLSCKIWTEDEVCKQENEKTQILNKDGNMEETKVLSCRIWTEEEVCKQENEKTQISNKDGNMEETNVLTGRIWTGLERNNCLTNSVNPMGNFRQMEEETKVFGKDDDMEETKALTGEISIAEVAAMEKTKRDEWLENTKTQTASNVLADHSMLKDEKEIESGQMEKPKIVMQEDTERKEKEEEYKTFSEMLNERKCSTSGFKEKVSELKECDPDEEDSEITFKIKKIEKENEMEKGLTDELMEKTEGQTASIMLEHSMLKDKKGVEIEGGQMEKTKTSIQEDTERKEKEEEYRQDGEIDDGNTRTLADLRNLLKKPTSKSNSILLSPEERLLKVSPESVNSSQIHKEVPCKNEENKTLMFSNQSGLIDETKPMTTRIETVSKQRTSEDGSMQGNKLTENKTILFSDGGAMMEETETVPAELAQENELLAYVGTQTKMNSGIVDKLPTIIGNNKNTFFGSEKGMMDEIESKLTTTSVDSVKTCSEREDILPSVDLFKLTENVMQDGKFNTDVTGVEKTDEKLPGLPMENSMVGLFEQAPPENMLTDMTLNCTTSPKSSLINATLNCTAPPGNMTSDATLNCTATSVRPGNTSSFALPLDSTLALLSRDCDSFLPDTLTGTEEGEKSLISQLSIKKSLECDETQEETWEGPMTALSLCNYLHVIKPSCLKASKLSQLRRTRCSFVPEEEICCDDLQSKLSALLMVEPHITTQMEIVAGKVAEVERKKKELEDLEQKWLTDPPEIFHYAQTCSHDQKIELREKMVALSNACSRQGKLEWKKAALQAATLELQKIQEGKRKLNLEVEKILEFAMEVVQNTEQLNQELLEMNEEELQKIPSPSEEDIQVYQAEKACLEKKQSELIDLKMEETSVIEANRELSREHASLTQKLSESVRLEKDDIQGLQTQSQKTHNEIQLLSGLSGWHIVDFDLRSNHKSFTFHQRKLQLDVEHGDERISSIDLRMCCEDELSRRERFCYHLAADVVQGWDFKQKYSRLADLPQILQEVGSLMSQTKYLLQDLMTLEFDHYILYRYPKAHLEVWSPRKRCVTVSYDFQNTAGSLQWKIEPSVTVEHGNFRMDAVLSQIIETSPGDSYLNRACSAINLDSLSEEPHKKCTVCGSGQS